jgi:hypothetical protein
MGIAKIFGVMIVLFFILIGITAEKRPEISRVNSTPSEKVEEVPTKKEESIQGTKEVIQDTNENKKTPKYELVYELANKRYDGGKSLYVLIDPVDLKSDAFKDDIKSIVKKIVSEKGNKISIEMHDKKAALDISYKQYGDLSLGRVRTREESEELAIHFIAAYEGDLATMIYLNTLMFFPAASKDTAKVGKYVETSDYDAAK